MGDVDITLYVTPFAQNHWVKVKIMFDLDFFTTESNLNLLLICIALFTSNVTKGFTYAHKTALQPT